MGNIDFNQIFDYKDGNLYWKIKPSLGVNIGDKAGTLNTFGYIQIKYKGTKRLAHRIIFYMMHGYVPKELDHINRIKTDNRIENLREVTRSENNKNKDIQKNNKSGVKNVCWHKASNKWIVQVNGKYCGIFSAIEKAKQVAMLEAHNEV